MRDKCKLCEKNEELQKSHILPRAFCKQVKDNGQYIYLEITGNSGISQDDWRENLFCSACEQIISSFENKAIPIFKEINKISRSSSFHTIEYKMSEDEYKCFELFKLSLLYRFLLVDNIFTNYYLKMFSLIFFLSNRIGFNKNIKLEEVEKNIYECIMRELKYILLCKEVPKKQYWNIKFKKMYDWDNKKNIENIIAMPHFNKSGYCKDKRMVFVLDGVIMESNMSMHSFFKPIEKNLNIKVPKVSVKYFEQLPFLAYSHENKNK